MASYPLLTRSAVVMVAATAFGGLFSASAIGGENMEARSRPPLVCDITNKVDPRGGPVERVGWQEHGVVRLNGTQSSLKLPAQFLLLSGAWDYSNAQMPYMVYMPEKRRLLMAAEVGPPPVRTVVTFSDDKGATWTKPRWMHTDGQGNPDLSAGTQLTYLGDGKLLSGADSYWFSNDYGGTWGDPIPVPKGVEGKPMWQWDPMLVDKAPKTGKVIRLVETRYKENGTFDTAGYFSQACVRFSADEARTWSNEIEVPSWRGVNEVVLARARNGDLVAACRTDNPKQFLGLENDQYSGLGISLSTDEGYTWSKLNTLYFWGRHHPSLVLMPGGELLLTYVVRNGYVNDKDGFPRFGIEAVVSRDNGQTWDLDHKYLLAAWTAKIKNSWWGAPQSTSTVLLPDGSLLTAFGTGVRNVPGQSICKMDVGLVKWRFSNRRVNSETTIRNAPFDSELRNKFDLDSVK